MEYLKVTVEVVEDNENGWGEGPLIFSKDIIYPISMFNDVITNVVEITEELLSRKVTFHSKQDCGEFLDWYFTDNDGNLIQVFIEYSV
jgi:hypothetical protein